LDGISLGEKVKIQKYYSIYSFKTEVNLDAFFFNFVLCETCNYYRPFPNSLILFLKLTSSQKIALGLIYYGFQSLGSIPCNNILPFDFSAFIF